MTPTIIIRGCAFFALALTAACSTPDPSGGWHVGPIIDGKTYSPGVPAPTLEGEGWWLDLPQAPAQLDAVQLYGVELTGASAIHVRFSVEAGPGVTFRQQEGEGPAYVSLVIQRKGDDWTADGKYEHYRWYHQHIAPLEPGAYDVTVPLTPDQWTSVYMASAKDHPQEFAAALADPSQVALAFGGSHGLSHGIVASGPARFHLERLEVVR